jgi:cytoskeletal protein RodZ
MRFCLECGTPLPDGGGAGGPMIINLSGSGGDKPTESLSGGAPPTNFGAPARETETFVAGRGGNAARGFGNFGSPPPQPPPRPKSNKKLFLILGGLASLLALLGVAVGGVVYYNYCCRPAPSPTPTPTPSVSPTVSPGKTKSPTPKTSPSVSPTVSPTASPDATAPQASFTPPTEPTKKGTFTVYANEGWQLSNIDVVALEKFTTSTQGLIDLAGIKNNVSVKGVDDAKTKARRIYPEYPTGALLMRTRYANGRYSNVQPISASNSWENFPDETGKLEFCVNDNAPQNNGGQFIVTKTSTSVPKPKKTGAN